MLMFVSIALGGAIGAVCRYAAALIVVSIWGAAFQPVATLSVNAIGSGLMGLCYGLVGLGVAVSDPMRGLIMIGFLGALTTFSSFSLDAIGLFEKGFYATALGYVLASVVISLLSFALMLALTRSLAASLTGGINGF
jgi:CrcB protein